MENMIGNTYGRLTVVGVDKAKPYHLICKCSCGNVTSVKKYSLTATDHPTRSCGCIRKERTSELGRRNIESNRAGNIAVMTRYNTNFSIIERTTPHKNNKSGHTGVWYNPVRGCYEAYICLHYKNFRLGRFSKYEDAVKARERAEEELFAPIIAEKNTDMMATRTRN